MMIYPMTAVLLGLLIASIYSTAKWETSGLAAFSWGIGLSLASTVANVIITCIPLYTFM